MFASEHTILKVVILFEVWAEEQTFKEGGKKLAGKKKHANEFFSCQVRIVFCAFCVICSVVPVTEKILTKYVTQIRSVKNESVTTFRYSAVGLTHSIVTEEK